MHTSRLAQLAIAVATSRPCCSRACRSLVKIGALPSLVSFPLFLLGGLLGLLALAARSDRALHDAPGQGPRRSRARVGRARAGGRGARRHRDRGEPRARRAADQRHHHRPGDPPQFAALAREGPNAGRDMSYPGEAFASQQRAGYPDLAPIAVERARPTRRSRRRSPRSRASAGRSSPPTRRRARSRHRHLADLPLRRRHRRADPPATARLARRRALEVARGPRRPRRERGADPAPARRARFVAREEPGADPWVPCSGQPASRRSATSPSSVAATSSANDPSRALLGQERDHQILARELRAGQPVRVAVDEHARGAHRVERARDERAAELAPAPLEDRVARVVVDVREAVRVRRDRAPRPALHAGPGSTARARKSAAASRSCGRA